MVLIGNCRPNGWLRAREVGRSLVLPYDLGLPEMELALYLVNIPFLDYPKELRRSQMLSKP